jgi:hypothetical protein
MSTLLGVSVPVATLYTIPGTSKPPLASLTTPASSFCFTACTILARRSLRTLVSFASGLEPFGEARMYTSSPAGVKSVLEKTARLQLEVYMHKSGWYEQVTAHSSPVASSVP